MATNQKANLLLHPVRLRIVTELYGRELTSRQLADALPDNPQATLYRQIKRLFEAGMLVVQQETAVNGAIERTYAVAEGQTNLTPEEIRHASPMEHVGYFSIFAASLIDTFSRYANQVDPAEIGRDGLSYSRAAIYLSPEEKEAFEQQINAALATVIAKGPAPNRKRYTLASVVIPDDRLNETHKE
mgnify:CR=1 FL=1